MWSLGVLLCELYTRRPLLPGTNLVNQLECVNAMLGSPSEDDLW